MRDCRVVTALALPIFCVTALVLRWRGDCRVVTALALPLFCVTALVLRWRGDCRVVTALALPLFCVTALVLCCVESDCVFSREVMTKECARVLDAQ